MTTTSPVTRRMSVLFNGLGPVLGLFFVYAIFFTLFLFFNSFALTQWLQYKRIGRWRNYLTGERTYILLSLLAKSALAWQVFGGTLVPPA